MINVKEILNVLDVIEYQGDDRCKISSVVSVDKANDVKNCLSWCNDKNLEKLNELNNESALILTSPNINLVDKKFNNIIVENPRRAFQILLTEFFLKKRDAIINKSAIVSEKIKLGKNVFIGNNVIIEDDCNIGDNVTILHNTVILEGTIIGNNVTIGANNTIGGTGFGYEKNKDGNFELIPHIGNVVVKDNVDIGNNTCIDRAVLGSTVLEENVKVDNLVHIAHGVVVGKNSVVIANAMVAGSVKIGENSWIAPSASIINKKNVGKNSLIGLGAVVTRNVKDNAIVAGNPAKFIRDNN